MILQFLIDMITYNANSVVRACCLAMQFKMDMIQIQKAEQSLHGFFVLCFLSVIQKLSEHKLKNVAHPCKPCQHHV